MRNAPLKAQRPDEQEVEIAEVFIAQDQPSAPPAAPSPTELPKTGSSLPLIALAGLLSLGVAGLMRLRALSAR